jgi:hypothetical protein
MTHHDIQEYKFLRTASLQALFNRMWRGLEKQGWQKSYHADAICGCAYKDTSRNRKCAVGHCIPTKDYSPDIEGLSVGNLMRRLEIGDKRTQFLRLSQDAHDNSRLDMQSRFELLAKRYDLKIPKTKEPT